MITTNFGNNGQDSTPEQVPPTEVKAKAERRRFTAKYKQQILREADKCTKPGELSALLRRERDELGGDDADGVEALLAEPDVSHVGVAFDSVIESFRNNLYAGYKTGEGIDPDLFGQFPLAERATVALGMVSWGMVEFEADDALAAAAARYAAEDGVRQVVICSPDKDLSQCVVGDRVVCLDRLRDTIRDEQGGGGGSCTTGSGTTSARSEAWEDRTPW